MKTRKTAQHCKYIGCNRLTRRFNGLCVRHRNHKPLIDKYNYQCTFFNKWKSFIENEKYGGIRNDWDLL